MDKKECTTYVVGNFKGGVGKTKLVTMLSYISASSFNKKTLVVDMDPQGNATRVLAKTGNIDSVTKSITKGFETGNLKPQIIPVIKNLDMIPSSTTFRNLTKILIEKFPDDEDKQIYYLKNLLDPIKNDYDVIYIDVPPTISDFSDNAMLAADYCIIVMQTQELSLDGVKIYISYMQYLADNYNSNLDVLGIVPMMLRPGGRVDEKVMKQAKELYKGNVLKTIIRYQERLKVYDVEGIRSLKDNLNVDGTKDIWDTRAHKTFVELLKELNRHEKILEEFKVNENN